MSRRVTHYCVILKIGTFSRDDYVCTTQETFLRFFRYFLEFLKLSCRNVSSLLAVSQWSTNKLLYGRCHNNHPSSNGYVTSTQLLLIIQKHSYASIQCQNHSEFDSFHSQHSEEYLNQFVKQKCIIQLCVNEPFRTTM